MGRRSSVYHWAKLEEMAQAMGMAFPEAHDASADVKMTVAVLRWASADVLQCPVSFSSCWHTLVISFQHEPGRHVPTSYHDQIRWAMSAPK